MEDELIKAQSMQTFEKITCALCNKHFLRITNTHLWKEHQLTVEDYRQQFPSALIDAPGLADFRVNHLRGKTYTEVYGEEKSSELKEVRSESAIKQMQSAEQIEIREEKCGKYFEQLPTTQQVELKELHRQNNTIHGAYNYRERAIAFYGLECARCGHTSENPDEFHVHHKNFVNMNTEIADHSLENLAVLCVSCHPKLHAEVMKLSKKFYGTKAIETGVHYIFKGLKQSLGLDLTDENFKETPARIARAYAEIFEGVAETETQIKEILSSAFPCERSEMVLVKGIRAFSMCPHHLLPVDYTINIAYIPTSEVIGLSKLARLAIVLARRPVLQEQFVEDVTNALMNINGCLGAACIASGKHYCMIMRGVCQPDTFTVTSSLKGAFLNEASAKAEFLSLAKFE